MASDRMGVVQVLPVGNDHRHWPLTLPCMPVSSLLLLDACIPCWWADAHKLQGTGQRKGSRPGRCRRCPGALLVDSRGHAGHTGCERQLGGHALWSPADSGGSAVQMLLVCCVCRCWERWMSSMGQWRGSCTMSPSTLTWWSPCLKQTSEFSGEAFSGYFATPELFPSLIASPRFLFQLLLVRESRFWWHWRTVHIPSFFPSNSLPLTLLSLQFLPPIFPHSLQLSPSNLPLANSL